MRCAHCKDGGSHITVDHVRACSQIEQSIRSIGSPRVNPAPAPAPKVVKSAPAPVTEPGVYFDGEHYYKVVFNQSQTNLYAKVWDAEWVYAPGAIKRLDARMRVTAEQAARFGKLWGSCVFCTRMLTDERSIAVGYGPRCAEREGLPWGITVDEAVARMRSNS